MPITILTPPPGVPQSPQITGWGTLVRASTDFIGPLPTDAHWTIQSWLDSLPERFAVNQQYPAVQGQPLNRYIGEAGLLDTALADQGFLTSGGRQASTMQLRVMLDAPSTGFHEETRTGIFWDEITQSPNLFGVIHATTANLTAQLDQIQAQLNAMGGVVNNIMTGITTTVQGITGPITQTLGQLQSGKVFHIGPRQSLSGGPTCLPIFHSLGISVWYGIQLECTTIPEWFTFTAPGDSFTPQDLAVVQILRGGELIARYGVHSRVWTLMPLPGLPTVQYIVNLPISPPQYDIQVDWGTGVCGELFALPFP